MALMTIYNTRIIMILILYHYLVELKCFPECYALLIQNRICLKKIEFYAKHLFIVWVGHLNHDQSNTGVSQNTNYGSATFM